MNRKYRRYTSNNNNNKKKKNNKTLIIIVIICFLIALLSLKIIFFSSKTIIEREKIYAGIGGAVKDGGVYEINEDTRIYELILSAEGLKERADIKNINVEEKVVPFEVYCIPYLLKKTLKKVITPKKAPPVKTVEKKLDFETRKINYVYVGLPRTFLLISVYPELDYIFTLHIPWYTLATAEFEYPRTLYEVYLTGGIPFMLRGIQRITGETIDHYFAHDRPSWINFIDYLGGVEMNIPDEFAEEYHLQVGKQKISGVLTWELIRFISKENRRNKTWITGSQNRIFIQQEFMKSLFRKFKHLNIVDQAGIVKKILSEAETDMKIDDAIKLASDVKQLKNTGKDFNTLPGSIREFDNRQMMVPNLNEFDIQRVKLLYEEHSKQLGFKTSDKGGFGGGEETLDELRRKYKEKLKGKK
ncbi:MAG: LCP family protein [Candidatus Marinimicrobia bacterium]|nr:LCP family protein [Candidatus Neomarinimicrobiota bacterium]